MAKSNKEQRLERRLQRIQKKRQQQHPHQQKHLRGKGLMNVQTLPVGNNTCAAGGFKLTQGGNGKDALYLCTPTGTRTIPPVVPILAPTSGGRNKSRSKSEGHLAGPPQNSRESHLRRNKIC